VQHELERRAASALASPQGRTLRGYAIAFNSLSADLGGFRELILPEAVDRTLREARDVRALVDHDPSQVLGRTTAGTLRLHKDERGLLAEIDPPDTQVGRDILTLVARGDVNGMSFAFTVPHGGDRFEVRDGVPVRIIHDMVIAEVSVVTFPAYAAADVQLAARADEVLRRRTSKGVRLEVLARRHRIQM
jgi:HK97 family phage prohead protease